MKRIGVKILLLLFIVSRIDGQNVNVTSAFDSSRIYIGDQIKFTIEVDQPTGIRLNTQAFKDTLCKNIEILSGPVVDSISGKDGRLKIISRYLITSFDSGFYQIRPVFAEVKNDDGIKRFYSDYSQLEVMRVKIAPADTTAKIYDIIKPYNAPVTFGEIIPWLLACLVLAAIIWGVVRFIKKNKKSKSEVEIVINPDPAHVIAFRELENLRLAELWQKGEVKVYYTKLTEILRQYLEKRFFVYSLELTTAETLDALVKSGFKKDAAFNNLKTVLTGADLVKFAKHKPDAVENDLNFKYAWDFIDFTKAEETVSDNSLAHFEKKEGGL